jgi:hypothetical protein
MFRGKYQKRTKPWSAGGSKLTKSKLNSWESGKNGVNPGISVKASLEDLLNVPGKVSKAH